MDQKMRRKRKAKKIVSAIMDSIYTKPEHVPKTIEEAVQNVYDFAVIERLVRRILVRRDN